MDVVTMYILNCNKISDNWLNCVLQDKCVLEFEIYIFRYWNYSLLKKISYVTLLYYSYTIYFVKNKLRITVRGKKTTFSKETKNKLY